MPKQNKQINRGKLCEDDMDIISRLATLPPKRLKMVLSAFVFFVVALSICGFYIVSKQATNDAANNIHHMVWDGTIKRGSGGLHAIRDKEVYREFYLDKKQAADWKEGKFEEVEKDVLKMEI